MGMNRDRGDRVGWWGFGAPLRLDYEDFRANLRAWMPADFE